MGVASQCMASIWVEGLGRSLEQALDLLAGAVRDCRDGLWEEAMWQVPSPTREHQFLRSDWSPVTDSEEHRALVQRWVQRRSTPWGVAWHALECFDYDLNGEFGPWAPPSPFAGHPHWRDLPSLAVAWSRSEILGYIDYCREGARKALAGMSDEKAARPLPPGHRYGDQPHAWVITALVAHTVEHGSQIRQFITAAGSADGIRPGR